MAQAVVTMHAEVEFRRVRALARAHEINATAQRLRLLHMVLEDEGELYANAASEPLDTSVGELLKCTKNQIRGNINLGVAAYSQDVMSFAVADSHLDRFEGTAHVSFHLFGGVSADKHSQGMLSDKLKSNITSKGLAEDRLAYSRPRDSVDVVEAQVINISITL
jgi:hypothetical protein